MPHLEFQTYAGQIFWLAVCFILLYAVLSTLVIPKISGVIESRGASIADNLKVAEEAKNEAERLSAHHDKLLSETGEKARKMIDESTAKARTLLDKKRAELTVKLDVKLEKAEKEILKVEKESIAAIDKLSGELANAIVSKFSSDSRAA